MRTNIVIDDKLMQDALKVTGLTTKREVVELGLRTLIRLTKQERIRSLRGKLTWEGNLDEMRLTKAVELDTKTIRAAKGEKTKTSGPTVKNANRPTGNSGSSAGSGSSKTSKPSKGAPSKPGSPK